MEKCKFVERISEFVEDYSQINTESNNLSIIFSIINFIDNEAAEIDKKTVLDLCAHMFHPKDTSHDRSDNSFNF